MPYRLQRYTDKTIEKIRVGYEALGKSLAMTALREKGRPWAVKIAQLAGYPEPWVNYWLNWAEKEPEMDDWASEQEQEKNKPGAKWKKTYQGRPSKHVASQKETVMAMGLWREGYDLQKSLDLLIQTRGQENQTQRLKDIRAKMDLEKNDQD